MNTNIYVTRPFLPKLEDFIPYLEGIWERRILTNGGPLHIELERALADYLGVKHISLFTNATIALVTALQSLEIKGEVITTPFSFVATAHSILWNGLKPIFVDIDPITLNISPEAIDAAITKDVSAVLPVHVYGTPCDVNGISSVAKKNNIKIIYDAAHAFGVNFQGKSLLEHGDLSVLSFHATKVFNTFEGGAIVCSDPELKKKIDFLRNFGFADETTVLHTGINGKMSELHAAIGLLQLKHMSSVLDLRRGVSDFYKLNLSGILGISFVPTPLDTSENHSYFPILVSDDFPIGREGLFAKLRENGIFARRYFYPLISEMPMYRDIPSSDRKNLPVSYSIANQILCLPIYPDLEKTSLERIVDVVKEASNCRRTVERKNA
jgi:dTDP-4-amino-4,6-dideoxygalactose transaminase